MKVIYQAQSLRDSDGKTLDLPVFLDSTRRIMQAPTQYMLDRIESGFWNSKHTIRSNQQALEHFFAYIQSKGINLLDIQLKHVVAWRRDLQLKKNLNTVSNQTINIRLRAVISFIEWAFENGYVHANFEGVKVETSSASGGVNFNQKQSVRKARRNRLLLTEAFTRAPLPTMNEINRFVTYVSKPFVPMVGLMLGTGMRISEIVSLPLSALPSYATVAQSPNTLHHIQLSPNSMTIKNNKARTVFIPGLLYLKIYDQVMNGTNHSNPRLFFASSSKSAWHPSTIQKNFLHASLKAQLRHTITPHILRHEFATRTLESWKDAGFPSEMACLIWLQKQLGHAHVSTTANIYINMTSELHANDRQVLHQYEKDISQMMEEERNA